MLDNVIKAVKEVRAIKTESSYKTEVCYKSGLYRLEYSKGNLELVPLLIYYKE